MEWSKFVEVDNTTKRNVLTSKFFDYKKLVEQKSAVLSKYLKNIMREIEEDCPSAPNCVGC